MDKSTYKTVLLTHEKIADNATPTPTQNSGDPLQTHNQETK